MTTARTRRKKLLTIGQVARLLDVSASSLRNWERLGLISPARTAGRYRLYSADEVRRLKRIQFLRRVKRINPTGILHMRRHEAELLNLPATGGREIGARLARLRLERGLSIEQAAQKATLSPASIRRMERGDGEPTVASLQKLTAVYGTSVLALFDNRDVVSALVRPRDRGVMVQPGVRIELLAFGERCMETMLFRVAPRATSGGSYQHEGE